MDDIARRVREVLEVRQLTERELAAKAKLASPTHIGLILDRGGERTSGTVLAKIADAAGVRVEWLILGRGARDLPADDAYRVVYDPRYPNLARACELAESASREARAQVLNQHWEMPGDQDVDWWLVHLRRTEDRILSEKAMPPAELAALKAAQRKVVDDLEAKELAAVAKAEREADERAKAKRVAGAKKPGGGG